MTTRNSLPNKHGSQRGGGGRAGRRSGAAICLSLLLLVAPCRALEPGDAAPDFELPGSDGERYRLSEVLASPGTQGVVLAWYPRAFTSGCTIECKSFARNGHLIEDYAVSFFMISVDQVEENTRFADAMEADFPLLSDASKATATAYGVLHQDRFALRTNFYIDASGEILAIDRNVDPETAAQDVAARLRELRIGKKSAP
ncbi:MAG: peroxiredoxin [Halieaceae bacterium]|jgi:peroxiredoxin Q/BCP|nr:peroxiredoxin [Halieaceae bacterium]